MWFRHCVLLRQFSVRKCRSFSSSLPTAWYVVLSMMVWKSHLKSALSKAVCYILRVKVSPQVCTVQSGVLHFTCERLTPSQHCSKRCVTFYVWKTHVKPALSKAVCYSVRSTWRCERLTASPVWKTHPTVQSGVLHCTFYMSHLKPTLLKAVCYIVLFIWFTLSPHCPKRCVTLYFLYVSP